MEQLKNPLVATALGITLALLLLSLSHLPKMVSHWFGHGKEDHSLSRQSYDTYERAYGGRNGRYLDRQDSIYQNAKDSVHHARDRAEDIYYHAKDAVLPRESFLHRARDAVMGGGRRAQEEWREHQPEHHESLLQRARDYLPGRHRHEEEQSLLQRAREAVTGGSGDSYRNSGSYVDQAQRAACRTAERARDIACDFSGSNSGSNLIERGREAYDSAKYQARDAVENARYQARDAANSARYQARDAEDTVAQRAQSIYEQAKARASEILESAKDTVTYPLQAARDSVVDTQERARGAAGSTVQAAKDSVYNAKEAVKDSVLGAGETVRNAAGSTVQGVKDTVQGVKEKLTFHDSGDINIDAHGSNGRGPTKIKVEVQEL